MQQQLRSDTPDPAKERTLREYVGLSLRGFAMGICEIIPGVSGGTMAFILGIYEELINSIKSVGDPSFIQAVFKLRIKDALEIVNWKFLLALVIGMGVAIISLAGVIDWMIHNQPVLLWSFFFGLVLASVFLVSRRVKQWNPLLAVLFVVAAVATFFLVGLRPAATPDAWWFLILAGAIAASALILPGVSGSYLLLVLQKYEYVIAAVNDLRIGVLIWVAIGVVIGLVTFAQVVSWIFKRYHDTAVAALSGLILGSLRAIWPWKAGVGCVENPEFCVNVLPQMNGEFGLALLVFFVGIVAIVAIEWLGNSAATEPVSSPVA